jgi:hypothetical protein
MTEVTDAIDAYGKIYDANGNGKTSGTDGSNQIVAGHSDGVDYMLGRGGNDSFHFLAKYTNNEPDAGPIDYVIYDFNGAGASKAGEQDFLHFTGYGEGSTITLDTSLGVNGVGQNFGTTGVYYFYKVHDTATGNDFVIKLKSMNGEKLSSSDFGFYSSVSAAAV